MVHREIRFILPVDEDSFCEAVCFGEQWRPAGDSFKGRRTKCTTVLPFLCAEFPTNLLHTLAHYAGDCYVNKRAGMDDDARTTAPTIGLGEECIHHTVPSCRVRIEFYGR